MLSSLNMMLPLLSPGELQVCKASACLPD